MTSWGVRWLGSWPLALRQGREELAGVCELSHRRLALVSVHKSQATFLTLLGKTKSKAGEKNPELLGDVHRVSDDTENSGVGGSPKPQCLDK